MNRCRTQLWRLENERYRKPGDGLKAVKALSDLMWDKIALKIRIS